MTPNLIAFCALIIWPFVSLALYLNRPTAEATLWTILGAYVLLPVGTEIKFEMIPQLDKYSIASFCALIGSMATAQTIGVQGVKIRLVEVLVAVFILSPVVSSELNSDPIYAGPRVLPGVGLYDAISAVESALITLIPFAIGRRYLQSLKDNYLIFRILVVVGLFYSFPLIFEMRFSPQLHNWVYGYFPTAFQQTMRGDGYRPMVFMGHGLLASFFLMTSVVASMVLWRVGASVVRVPLKFVSLYLGTILLLCRSAGATVYGAGLAILVGFVSPRGQMRVAIVLATLSIFYPLLRLADVVPTQWIVNTAQMISDERSKSIAYRFLNEDILLKRASERWAFGWGRFGRSRVYDEKTGDDIVVTDGQWIQVFGDFGAIGFIAEFGLFGLSIFGAALALKRCQSERDRIFLAGLALIVAINMVDLLPNNSLRPWTWLLCGSLLGRAERLRANANGRSARTIRAPNLASRDFMGVDTNVGS